VNSLRPLCFFNDGEIREIFRGFIEGLPLLRRSSDSVVDEVSQGWPRP
jgi:hypothetical protein